MDQKTNWWRSWEITIDSNWYVTIGMASLFVICGLLLAQEIYYVAEGRFLGPEHLRINFWSICDTVFEGIVAIYFFMFAFRFPKMSVEIASVLMGANYAVFAVLSFFRVSLTMSHVVAMSGSAARQIALIMFCIAIANWFKSVSRWIPPADPENDL